MSTKAAGLLAVAAAVLGCGGSNGPPAATCSVTFTTSGLATVNALIGASTPVIAAGDFDGDGQVDLAVAGDGVTVLRGKGDGTFVIGADYDAGMSPEAIVTDDFNGDGKLDLATVGAGGASGTEVVRVLLGTGSGTFRSALGSPAESGMRPSLAVGDFNRDGALDLAMVLTSVVTVSVLIGNGDGTFAAPIGYMAGGSGNRRTIAGGDFTGDGIIDLAVRDQDFAGIMVLPGNGDGTFRPTGGSLSSPDNEWAFTSADFNGDGTLDVAVTRLTSDAVTGNVITPVGVLLGNGGGKFQSEADYVAGPVGAAQLSRNDRSVVTGDFDGDGKVDLIAGGDGLSLLLGDGAGAFRALPANANSVSPGPGSVEASMAAADFDRDGKSDLATVSPGILGIAMSRCVR